MKNRGKGRFWFWLSVVIIVVGLGFYLFVKIGQEQEEGSPETTRPELKQQGLDAETEEILAGPSESEPVREDLSAEDPCLQIEKQLAEFFRYLDGKKYIQSQDQKRSTYARFRKIIERLEAMPPIPAGEGADPGIIIRNINHFFRILDRNDFRLIKEILANEHGSLETDIGLFYRWVTLGKQCPTTKEERPSMKSTYLYAGFFLNTIGGRAYMFRRTSSLRLLVNYYCILIIHEMDKAGQNTYGINLIPHIVPLKQEISHYPDFLFLQEYLDQLNRIERYYMQKK